MRKADAPPVSTQLADKAQLHARRCLKEKRRLHDLDQLGNGLKHGAPLQWGPSIQLSITEYPVANSQNLLHKRRHLHSAHHTEKLIVKSGSPM